MEQPSRLNAEIGLEEKNSILQAWTDFKDSIFNVLFVILDKKSQDEEEESLVRLALESGLDYLQIMAFPFHAVVIQAWNGGESLSGLARFFKQFSIGSYLPGAPFSAFLVVLYGLIFIILLIIIDIVYVSYSFSKKKFRFTFPLVVLAQVVPLFVTVLFLPITEVLLNVVECEREEMGWVMSSFPTVQCWTGWHLFHSTITLLFVAIFVIISSVVALALFQPRMTAGRLTARQNSNGEVVFILNKIVLLFLFIFNPVQGSFFYVTAMFLLSFWQFWCYSVKQPFYSKVATKFFKVCSTYYFWTTLMLFIGQILGPYGFDGALVIWMSGLPFFAVIVYFETPSDVNTLFVSNLKFKSGQQLQAHTGYVLQLVGSQGMDKNSYMLLIGYIQKHKQICNEGDCPLKAERKRRRGEDNMEQSCQQVLKQVERMFKAGVKKFPECTKLRMSFAFFHLEHLKNKEKAYQEFTAASKLDPSFQQQFNIYRFKKIIRQNLESREGSDADLIETIRFQNYVSLLEQAMLLSAKLHKEFWTELKEEIPDLKKLNLVGAQITEAGNNIAQNYSQLSKINSAACEVLYSYAHYLILVSEDYAQGRDMLANARKIYQDRQSGHRAGETLHFQQHSLNKMTAPVLILAHPNSPSALPTIKNVNLMFTEVTGYQREELLDRDVSRIAPRLFENEGVSPFQLTVSEERDRQGFLNHKFTHLIPVQYSVTLKDGDWHVVFKLSSSSSMRLLLLTDPQGVITDSNLLAQTAFREVESQLLSEGKVFSMAQIGLQNFSSPQFRRQNGCLTQMRLGGRLGECMVQVQGVNAHVYAASGQGDDEQQQMVVVSERSIGFKVSLSRNERAHLSQSDLSSQSQQKEGQLDGGVLQLYDNPNVIDIFISNLAETRQLQEGPPRFELAEKIKTMRLLNNEIKMVYAEGGENDYSDAAGTRGTDDQRELFKFDDQGYQAKLRAAINTNLNHIQVARLRRASLLFLLLLFSLNALQLYFQSSTVVAVTNFLSQGSARAEEYSLLTSNIMATIDATANYSSLLQSNSEHQVAFDSQVAVALQLQNSLTVNRNLKDAVVMLNSRLQSYFQQPSSPNTISSVFINYISAIYPAFLNYRSSVSVSLGVQIGLAGAVGVLAVLMMCYWIYIGLLIDKKRYDIMIWFLDIPVPYVAHLGNHCDKYLKEFATVKELTQRGISLEEDEDAYEEYSNKKGANDEQQIEEQIKARKSLISKNKKQTLISKVNLGSLKVLWLLLYTSCFSVLMLVLSSNFNADYKFLLPQWQQTAQAITIDNTLYLVIQMQTHNISAGSTDLKALTTTLQLSHKGVITENNLESFNYNILTFHLTDVATVYNTVYFSNLCTVLPLSPSNLTQCQSLVGSKLKSGYQVYSKYLITPEAIMYNQVWLANQLYVIPALLSMLSVWEGSLASEGNGMINLGTILLYVFVILSVLAFLLLWLYYLRKLNTELNQTIQMLNMIPFKLLPKSRKETKLFIVWIIREANKTRHQNQ